MAAPIRHPVALVLRDMITQYFGFYALAVRRDRTAGRDAVAALIDGLAGAMALQVAGGHGTREEIEAATIERLRTCLQRDLQHLARQ
jgi:hypothetical protein